MDNTQKAITVRLPLPLWEAFKIKLIKEGLSAQEFFERKVEEFVEKAAK